ncbi:hypothetical protein GGR56DRAFT_643174 [Xylariaceae sp. FL0804]|nr:hypothetical protein GGR56DRAFT_643174 [Xylariaceae sp. FL0804]
MAAEEKVLKKNAGERERKEEEEEEEYKLLPKSRRVDRQTAASLTPAQVSWLASLPVILRLGPLGPPYGDVVVVHAGLVPGVPLERQDPVAARNVRTLLYPSGASAADDPDHYQVPTPSEGRDGVPWAEAWTAFQQRRRHAAPAPAAAAGSHSSTTTTTTTVVYGHDSRAGRREYEYALGLDSGCVRGGALTAVVFEEVEEQEKGERRIVIRHHFEDVPCEAAGSGSDGEKGGREKKKDKKKGKENEEKQKAK